MSLSLWLIAPLIGLVLALFAAGGGMIAVPLLSFGIGMPLKQAIATSLVIVAAVSLGALLQNRRWQLIRWPLHRYFAIGGMVGGYIGAHIGLSMADRTQAIILSVLVLVAAVWIHSDRMQLIRAHTKQQPSNCRYALLAGLVSGTVTGLLGIGAGFLVVPLLLMLGVDSYKSAVAHALILIISSSLVAAISYGEALDIAWQPLVIMVLLALIGSWLGSILATRLPSHSLQKGFSLLLGVVATWIMIREFG